MLRNANISRLPASGVVALTAYALVAGTTLPKHYQFGSLALLQAVDAGLQTYVMGSVGNAGGGWRHRGLRLSFAGTGNENSQCLHKVYAVFAAEGGQRVVRLLGEVTVTYSATVGAEGLLADANTVRIADGISWSESAWYTAERAANGIAAASAFSPGSDLEGVLTIADCLGCSEILIDTDLQANATGAVVFAEGFT